MLQEFKNIICTINENDKQITWRNDDPNLETYHAFKQETELLNKIMPFLKNNNTMVQAGGNCGLQIEKFANHFNTVYTFEPDPINFYCLVNNLALMNVIKLQACVGKERGTASMNFYPNIGGFNVGTEPGNIPVMLVDDLNLTSCDLIQFDVEGFEMNALLGSEKTIKNHKPVVCLELYEQWLYRYGNSSKEVFSFMNNLGYIAIDSYITDIIFAHKDNL
jgi:FkbM family methyltransferase